MDVANRPLHLTKLYEGHERSRASFAMYLAKTFAARAGLTSWEGVRILDLGCGNGNIARLFASLGAHVTGVECDLGRVSGILREQPNFNVIAADGHNLPLDDKSFDFVILSDVLEHAYDPARMLREVARVIRPGGMAYIGATNRTSFVNIMFDPHYNAPLIPLMSKRVATWYVTRFLKFSNTFNVEKYFVRGEFLACIETAGFTCDNLPIYQDKLRVSELATAPGRKILQTALSAPGFRRFAVWIAGTLPFEYFLAPGLNFLCVRTTESYCMM